MDSGQILASPSGGDYVEAGPVDTGVSDAEAVELGRKPSALLEQLQSTRDVKFITCSGRPFQTVPEGVALGDAPVAGDSVPKTTSESLYSSIKRISRIVFPSFDPKSEVLQNNSEDTWYPTTNQREESSAPKPLPRRLFVNDREKNGQFKFAGNTVITSKYTVWNFLPLHLLKEFKQTANFYFLLVGIGQMIPAVSITGGVPVTYFALGFVIAVDGIFEAMADRKRHKADKRANSAKTLRFDPQQRQFVKTQWREICVGDIVKVENRCTAPADLLIISVAEKEDVPPQGVCFVETKSLDGETNLKVRESLQCLLGTVMKDEDVERVKGEIQCEAPNHDTNSFRGRYIDEKGESFNIDLKNMLLRGTTLRNVDYAYGIVVNTGVDTKIMQSSKPTPQKIGQIAEIINRKIVYIILTLLVICLLAGALCSWWVATNLDTATYLILQDTSPPYPFFNNALGFIIYVFFFWGLTSSFVPITLYVSIAVTKTWQAWFISNDLKMYYEPTDMPANARNPDLNDQLGQISHIFSDKTGTLTANIMDFRKFSINGVAYGKGTTEIGRVAIKRAGKQASLRDIKADSLEVDQPPNVKFLDPDDEFKLDREGARGQDHASKIEEFLLHLSICHTVIPEHHQGSEDRTQVTWSASSPDEQALVAGAAFLGYKFIDRRPGMIFVETKGGIQEFEVLDVIEFNSTRKRMSTVIRFADGSLRLYSKGADSVMLQRINRETNAEQLVESTVEHLERFALDGLRTLVLAYRELDEDEYEEWATEYHAVLLDLEEVDKRGRGEDNKIDRLENRLEQGLMLLGATAIEDRLQDGVPQTISDLMKAGIKLWVLTGDKEETAINIAFACQLLSNDMDRIIINNSNFPTKGALKKALRAYAEEMTGYWEVNGHLLPAERPAIAPKALIIDGASLSLIFDSLYLQQLLLEFAQHCVALVGCRVSPKQKAQMVALVKDNILDVRTLAIGDGANDVSMIQEAHVGIGISGQEGAQAVNNSDYAIAQFAYLKRLLLVHGHWCYFRMSKTCLYIIYKNVLFQWCLYLYAMYAALSGSRFYNNAWINLYNTLYTAVPIVAVSILDQEVPDVMAERYPAIYRAGWKNELFSTGVFWAWCGCLYFEGSLLSLFASPARANALYPSCRVRSEAWCIHSFLSFFSPFLGRNCDPGFAEALFEGVICVFVPLWFYGRFDHNGAFYGFWDCGAVSWTAMMVVSSLKLIFNAATFDWPLHLAVWLSLIVYGLSAIAFNYAGMPSVMDWAFPYLYEIPMFYIVVIVTSVMALARDIYWKGWKREFYPEYYHLIREAFWYKVDTSNLDWNPPVEQTTFFVADRSLEEAYEDDDHDFDIDIKEHAGAQHKGFAFSSADHNLKALKRLVEVPSELVSAKARAKRDLKFRELISSLPPAQAEVWENQRNNLISGFGSTRAHLFPQDPLKFSTMSRTEGAFNFDLADWEVDMSVPNCDAEGWEYNYSFLSMSRTFKIKHFKSATARKGEINDKDGLRKLKLCRRRRWIRRGLGTPAKKLYEELLREGEASGGAKEEDETVPRAVGTHIVLGDQVGH